MSHAQEPWSFVEHPGEANEFAIVGPGGRWLMAFRQNGELMPERQRDSIRRAVACVNALAGIPDEVILESLAAPEMSGRHAIDRLLAAWVRMEERRP